MQDLSSEWFWYSSSIRMNGAHMSAAHDGVADRALPFDPPTRKRISFGSDRKSALAQSCPLRDNVAIVDQLGRALFAEITRRQLRGVHTSTNQLEQDIRFFIKRPDEILAPIEHFYHRRPHTCGKLSIRTTSAGIVAWA